MKIIFCLQRGGDNIVRTPTTPGKRKPGRPKYIASTSSISNDSSSKDPPCVADIFQNYLFPRLTGLSGSNEARIMGEQQRPFFDAIDETMSNNSCNKTLSHQLRNSLRHMKNNIKIQLKCRGRSQSFSSDDGVVAFEVGSPTEKIQLEKPVIPKGDIEYLEKEIELEKELAQKCMAEFTTYIQSIESDS